VWTGPWAIPVSILRQDAAGQPTLVIADGGRAQSCVARAAYPGSVFVSDILGTGENRSNWQHLMLLETAGHRLLGVQVAQVLACARFATQVPGGKRLQLVGDGAVASFVCLVAAALEPGLFSKLVVHGNVASLVHLIESGERYETSQPLFCFGLLEVADVPQLTALLEGVAYEQPARAVPGKV